MKQKHDDDDDRLHQHSTSSFRDLTSDKGVTETTTTTAPTRKTPQKTALIASCADTTTATEPSVQKDTKFAPFRHKMDPNASEQNQPQKEQKNSNKRDDRFDSMKRQKRALHLAPAVADSGALRAQEETLVNIVETMDSVKRRQKARRRKVDAIDNPYAHAQQPTQAKQEKCAVAGTVTNAGMLRLAPAVADPGLRAQEETLVNIVETMDSVKRREKARRQADAVAEPNVPAQQPTQAKQEKSTVVATVTNPGMLRHAPAVADPGVRTQEETSVNIVETMDSVKRREKARRQADAVAEPNVPAQQQTQTNHENSTVVATVANPDILRLAPAVANPGVKRMDSVNRRQEALKLADAVANPYEHAQQQTQTTQEKSTVAATRANPGMQGKEERMANIAEAMDSVKRRLKELRQARAVDNPSVHVQQQAQPKKEMSKMVAVVSDVAMQPTAETSWNMVDSMESVNQRARRLEAVAEEARQSEQYRNTIFPGAVHVGTRLSDISILEAIRQQSENRGRRIWRHASEHDDDISSEFSDLPPCFEANLVSESEKGEESEIFIAEAVPKRLSRQLLIAISLIILIAGNLTLGLVFSRKNRQETSDPFITESDDDSDKSLSISGPILQTVKGRGFIRCKPEEVELRENKGFSLDLCRAIAAGIFDDVIDGNTSRIEFINIPFGEQFVALWNGTIDVSTDIVTHNMVRDVYEPSTGLRMAFSTPYFYSGMIFAGKPTFVDCAERRDSLNGECRGLSVCVVSETTHAKNLRSILRGLPIHEGTDVSNLSEMFVNNTCNVIASEIFWTKEQFVRDMGYEGEYIIGSKLFSNEPLSITSKGDDQEWADFCNWILQALIAAEALDITQETALSSSLWSDATTTGGNFPETTFVFGDEYKNMFRNAIASVGNYGEVYERNFESFAPRSSGIVNNMNYGESGLLYSFPFGDLTISSGSTSIPPPGPMIGGTLESIAGRGVLRCGISGDRPGFALLESSNENVEIRSWAGLDVEYCRAIAAALFPEVIFDQDSVIEFVDVGSNGADGYIALDDDRIDIFVGGSMTLSSDIKETTTGKGFIFSLPYFYYDTNDMMLNVFIDEKIGLSLVTRETDTQWSAFVRWISIALIYAEEHDITQELAFDMPILDLFGSQYFQMFRDAVLAVGNYGEMFNRTLDVPHNISRAGRNLINSNSGPQFIPFPF